MPEIKHNFTGGKMNKDLDERIVPNGEYRDAMNVQVTTSEGGDVGTVQNVLGNTLGCENSATLIPESSVAVGSISDEKNDSLYWLVAGGAFSQLQHHLYDPFYNTYSSSSLVGDVLYSRDVIMRKNNDGCEPVFVDIFGVAISNDEGIIGNQEINGVTNSITIKNEDLRLAVEVGMTVQGLDNNLNPIDCGGLPCKAKVVGVGAINVIHTSYTPNTYVQGSVNYASGLSIGSDDGTMQGGFEIEYGVCNTPWRPNGNIIIHRDAMTNIAAAGAIGAGIRATGLEVGDKIHIENTATGGNGRIIQYATVTGIEIINNIYTRIIHDQSPGWGCGGGGTNYYVGNWANISGGAWATPCQGMRAGEPGYCDYSGSPISLLGTLAFTPGTTISAFREVENYHNYIDLPSYSPWLDELYYTFFEDDNTPRQGAEIQLQSNSAWGDQGDGIGGCIDWETTYGWNGTGFDAGATFHQTTRLYIADCNDFNIPIVPYSNFNAVRLVSTGQGFQDLIVLNRELNFGQDITAWFNFTRDRVLNFRHDRLITGINIIDDMLFWTDGFTEPKKINIPRSIQGTQSDGQKHTRVINNINEPIQLQQIPIREDHITVIKKSPTTPLTMQLDTGRNVDLTHTAVMQIATSSSQGLSSFRGTKHYDFSALSVGDYFILDLTESIKGDTEFTLSKANGKPWEPGTKIALKEFDEDGEAPTLSVENYRIKATVGDWQWNKMDAEDGDPARVQLRIDFIEGSVPSTDSVLKFAVDLYEESEKLFEFKFPRFSYRYKYEDGEYSSFGPFTEVAFVPGGFNYHPRKGYNLGMTNTLKSVTLKDFITVDLPEDVVSIDLLYKDDKSPSIYIIDTVSYKDEHIENSNEWQKNEYFIDSDIIHAVVPANQLLRPWDNVPKKAVAQEITKNRLIYGNYTQGYDLTIGGANIKPQFKHSLVSNEISVKSIKSLREYQLGVVFIDKYGRETPVITNRTGGFKVSKNESANQNKLKVGFRGDSIPQDIEYFKFFIKETSGEYYNMAMDRWYDAEDGGVWLAFPSSDRNKVDEDTFLILKKGVESSSLVREAARYKILSIQNEAPDFVKTSKYNIGDVKQAGATNSLYGSDMEHAPKKGRNTFSCLASRFNGTALSEIDKIQDDLYVEFYLEGKKNFSHRYRISSVSKDIADDGTTSADARFNFTIDDYFEDDINFVLSGSTASPSKIKENARTRFYKGTKENLPKFDGKFFIKIYADEHFNKYIADPPTTGDTRTEYGGVDSKKIYFLSPDNESIHHGDFDATAFGSATYLSDIMNTITQVMPQAGLAGPGQWVESAEQGIGAFFIESMRLLKYRGLMKFWNQAPRTSAINKLWGANRAFFKNTVTRLWNTNGYNTIENLDNVGRYTYDGDVAGSGGDDYGLRWLFGLQADNRLRNKNTDPDGYNKLEYEDVFFIDQAPFTGTQGYRTDGFRDNCFGGNPSNEAHGNAGVGSGIQTINANTGRLNLGFGPITPDQQTPTAYDGGWTWGDKSWGHKDTNGDQSNWHIWDDGFWDLNRDGGRYEDAGQFIDRFQSGVKFHWLEDPSATIYTLDGSVYNTNRARIMGEGDSQTPRPGLFGSQFGIDGFKWRSEHGDVRNFLTRAYHPLYYTGENWQDSTRTNFYPAMNSWEPTNNAVLGPITGGRNISVTSGASPNVLAAVPTAKIQSVSGSWNYNSFRILKEDFLGAFDTDNGLTLLSTGEEEVGEFGSITEGMIVTHVIQPTSGADDTDNPSAISNITESTGELSQTPLLIESIEEVDNQFVIKVVGYKSVYATAADGTTLASLNSTNSGVLNLRFRQPAMNGLSPNSIKNLNFYSYETPGRWVGVGAVGYTLEILEPIERAELLPKKPAVWETEPKESTDLDIYYEISGKNAVELNKNSIKTALPLGSILSTKDKSISSSKSEIVAHPSNLGDTILISPPVCINPNGCPDEIEFFDINEDILLVDRPDRSKLTISVVEALPSDDTDFSNRLILSKNIYNSSYTLNWGNCFSFGNGVESNRIRDSFNLPFITNGVKASTTLEEEYKEEQRKSGLIYSGIYNSTSGINNLNQFIQAEKITKDINPAYGSIQKLHTRDSNLITLCEDKVLKILAHKDALFNADGNPQLIATDKVLGQATPFVGEFGISKNPESFASESYRAYFTDKVRGAVIRLSRDGITPISDHGMKDWFRDNLKHYNYLIGSYDDYKDEYNITMGRGGSKSVTFREDVKGWVSFKSFAQESGLSCANKYYTFKEGKLYQHHVEVNIFNNPIGRNTFYGVHTPSSFRVFLNDQPEIVKSFKTLSYEGSQAKIDQLLSYQIYIPGTIDPATGVGVVHPGANMPLSDGEYYNLENVDGWHVSHIETDLEIGSLNEFIEKEGKWFNYIKGKPVVSTNSGLVVDRFTDGDTSFQGLGRLNAAPQVFTATGCTDPNASNFNVNAAIDDGSCITPIFGCTDLNASNPCTNGCNTDDGSCIYLGCTDPTAFNYDANANQNDGSCMAVINGCTDATAFNYNSSANTDDGSCEPVVFGCTNATADNYNNLANTDDGSCFWTIPGCTDINSCNYDTTATSDDGSCTYCGDSNADNYDGASAGCTTGCLACDFDNDGFIMLNPNPQQTDTTIGITWQTPISMYQQNVYNSAPVVQYEIRYSEAGQNIWTVITTNTAPAQLYTIQNLTQNTNYDIQVRSVCSTTASNWSPVITQFTLVTVVHGCTDATACNYDNNANTDDGSCEFTSCAGCMDQTYLGYDPAATIDDPSQCGGLIVWGCTDSSMYNYDSNANTDDGSCQPFVYGCTDDTLGVNGTVAATNYNANANADDNSCEYETMSDSTLEWQHAGGTSPYELVLTVGNLPIGTTVQYFGLRQQELGNSTNSTDFTPDLFTGFALQSNVSEYVIVSVSSSTVHNNFSAYNQNQLHNGHLTFKYNGLTLPPTLPGLSVHYLMTLLTLYAGCTDSTACNYNASFNIDDGSCTYPDGCDDSSALNYDASITCPDNTNDCVYCETDPDVANAAMVITPDVYDGSGNLALPAYPSVQWTNVGTDATNGTNQLLGSSNAGTAPAYKVEYKYKLVGQGWSTSWEEINKFASSSCGNTTSFGPPDPTYGGPIMLSSILGPGAGYGPDDGRYDSGAKWKFKIRNKCADCTVAPPILTPTITIP